MEGVACDRLCKLLARVLMFGRLQSQTGYLFFYIPRVWQTEDNYAAFRVVCSGCRSLCTSCSFEEPQVEPTCTRVLDHTSSPGGTVTLAQIRIDPGYWRATESTTNVLACYNADACLGGVTGTAGYCREGSDGPCKRC